MKLILQASHELFSSSIPEIPSPISLAVIVTVLAASVVLSIRHPVPAGAAAPTDRDEDSSAHGFAGEQPPIRETRSPDRRRKDD
ncbi:hypothetical protein ACFUV2_05565 [Streptomyces pilosus]|uniref:hypothetical protein n=1 Tax=Streptomyces pilosus TaxID=28893 RepID=UPI0019AA8681|nr:hypothetical protein GCM10010261_49730 [Streptomyces pilosus]